MVPSGSIATMVLGLDGDDLVVVSHPPEGGDRENLGSSPLADRSVRGPERSVLATGVAARRAFDRARDEWRVLMSGALVGLGEAALALGVDYAKERHQFGVPIGSFQSIARDLADVATLVDGALLLAREAAWAEAEEDQEFASLAGMAFLFAARAAQRASNVALHVHGGYGYTLEYDIGLYYRRAKAWPLAAGRSAARGCSIWPTPCSVRSGWPDGLPARSEERRLPRGGAASSSTRTVEHEVIELAARDRNGCTTGTSSCHRRAGVDRRLVAGEYGGQEPRPVRDDRPEVTSCGWRVRPPTAWGFAHRVPDDPPCRDRGAEA